MSQKIIRTVLEKPSSANWTIAELGTALATELGINFNTENNVLYMGTDDNSGIELAQSTSSATAITMYPYYGGIRLTNNTMGIWDGSALSYNNILFYIKTDNAIIFRATASNNSYAETNYDKLSTAIIKGKNSENEDKYMYVGTSGGTSSYILLSENSNTYKLITNGYNRTRNTVTLSPIAIETDDDVIYSDYLYTASQIKDCNTNTAFELDGHEYLTLGFGRVNNAYAIVVIKLY